MFSQTPLCGPLPSDDGQAWTVCGGSGAADVLVDVLVDVEVDVDVDVGVDDAVEPVAEDDADPELEEAELDPLPLCACEPELRAPESW